MHFPDLKIPQLDSLRADSINLKFDYNSPILQIVVIILAIFVVAFLIDYLLSRSILGKNYRLFVGAGVIIHELSHALLCLITLAKITKISFFDKDGGRVEHEPSKIPIIGPTLISLAPFVIGAVLIYILSKRLGLASFNVTNVELLRGNILDFFHDSIKNFNYRDLKNWAIVYLVLSIAVTMTPSKQDFKNILSSLLVIGIVLVLLGMFNIVKYSSLMIPTEVSTLLSTVLLLLILSLIFSIVIYILSRVIKK